VPVEHRAADGGQQAHDHGRGLDVDARRDVQGVAGTSERGVEISLAGEAAHALHLVGGNDALGGGVHR